MTNIPEDVDSEELPVYGDVPEGAMALQCGRIIGPDGDIIGRLDREPDMEGVDG